MAQKALFKEAPWMPFVGDGFRNFFHSTGSREIHHGYIYGYKIYKKSIV